MALVIELLLKLEDDCREKNKPATCKSISTATAVMTSGLLFRCYKLLGICEGDNCEIMLEQFLKEESIHSPVSMLPPISEATLRRRIKRMHIPNHYEFHTVNLPGANPSKPSKGSGLILRQHMIDDEVKGVYIVGVERNTPASRADNLKFGDKLLAVNNIPLDDLTLEQLRFGLLDQSEQFRGLDMNGSLFDLASHLLNKPYHDDPIGARGLPVIVARRPGDRRPSLNDEEEQTNVLSALYQETVVEMRRDTSDLGVKLEADDDTSGVRVSSIVPGGAADTSGGLQEGDRIIEVNYQNIENLPAEQAKQIIESACQKTKFVQLKTLHKVLTTRGSSSTEPATPSRIRQSLMMSDSRSDIRSQTINHDEQSDSDVESLNIEIEAKRVKTGSHEEDPVASDIDDGSQGQEQDQTMKNIAAKSPRTMSQLSPGEGVSVASDMAHASPDQEMQTTADDRQNIREYWEAHFTPEIQIVMADYDITDSPCGLGISLEGMIEYPRGDRPGEQHHYVVDLAKECPVHIKRALKPGDELLQINSHILVGSDHLEVAKHLHEAPSIGYIVCARIGQTLSSDSFHDIAIHGRVTDVDVTELSTTGQESLSSSQNAPEGEFSSVASSDVDEHPQIPHYITPRRTEQSEPLELDIVDEVTEPDQMSLQHTKRAGSTLRERRTSSFSPDTNGLNRFPMPPRLHLSDLSARSIEITTSRDGDQMEMKKRIPQKSYAAHADANGVSIRYDEERACFALRVYKEAGQFLGLELEPKDGDSDGIRLSTIVHGTVLEHAHQTLMKDAVRNSDIYFPRPGDRILGVGNVSFRHQSGFTARSFLRRIVYEEGELIIYYQPSTRVGVIQ